MLNLEVSDTDVSIGNGFDQRLNRSSLIEIFNKSRFEQAEIQKNDTFSKKMISDFVDAIIKDPVERNIKTDNISFIKIVNENLRLKSRKKRILVIDNHNFFHRVFHAYPVMVSNYGIETTLLKATINFLKWLMTQDRYTHIIFATEGNNLKRKLYYPEYKANRKTTDSSLKSQIAFTENFLRKIGFNVLSLDGYEADDILASVVYQASLRKVPVTGFTSDKDALQLSTFEGFEILNTHKEVKLAKDILMEKYGLLPEQFIAYQAIVGDTSDNVPGAKNFGDVAAKDIISQYSSIEEIFENIENLWIEEGVDKSRKKQDKLKKQEDNIFISKNLILLSTDLLEDISFKDYPMPFKNFEYILKR